jgi:hypothetical protein
MELSHKHAVALTVLISFSCLNTFGQNAGYESAVNEYIERFKYIAIREMSDYGIPASITLAQGILESNAGRSDLAVKANNHFGIKCHKEWTGATLYQDDDKPGECFRKYDDPLDSYRDHSLFLTTRDRYKSLFTLASDDYRGWAAGLKAAGYATNPQYADLLIKTIERFYLHQYDRSDMAVQPVPPAPLPGAGPLISKMECSYFAPGPGGRKTYTANHTHFTVAGKGEKLDDLAGIFGIPVRKLAVYNDMTRGQTLREGDPVFLAKKQKKGEARSHKVEKGQSMWEISQAYAIRLNKLYWRNKMAYGSDPVEGHVLKLR